MAKLIMIMALTLIIVSGLVAGCSPDQEPEPTSAPDNTAPDFQLQGLDGDIVTLSGLKGSPVMLNFWATWCGPCQMEMPFIQGVYEDEEWREQGLVILAVNIGESSSDVEGFVEANGLTFTVLLDGDKNVAESYNIRGIPATFFIDKNGIIKESKIGTFKSKADIDWILLNTIMESE